jgi:hypothetical protein
MRDGMGNMQFQTILSPANILNGNFVVEIDNNLNILTVYRQ